MAPLGHFTTNPILPQNLVGEPSRLTPAALEVFDWVHVLGVYRRFSILMEVLARALEHR